MPCLRRLSNPVLICEFFNLFCPNQLAARIVQSDTVAAIKAIQEILDSVDDHGVIDVFKRYPTKELVAAIYALSRLQAASEFHLGQIAKRRKFGPLKDFPRLEENELLDELCHYAPFASAAYGWKLDLATAGRIHRGDSNAVVKMTKIQPDDVIKVEWGSRANRPVSRYGKGFCVPLYSNHFSFPNARLFTLQEIGDGRQSSSPYVELGPHTIFLQTCAARQKNILFPRNAMRLTMGC